VTLSDLFHRLFPAGLLVAVVAIALVGLLPRWKRSTLLAGSLALLLLVEPFAFLTTMLVPNLFYLDNGFGTALFTWLLLAVLPMMLPLTAMWVVYRRTYEPLRSAPAPTVGQG